MKLLTAINTGVTFGWRVCRELLLKVLQLSCVSEELLESLVKFEKGA